MATEIVHGNPGSYKSAALIFLYGINALKKGRTVVTNIRGFDDIEKIESVYDCAFPPGANLVNVGFNEEGFSKMARFFHWVPEGACILMDEGQRVYPTRLRSLSEFDCDLDNRPPTVEEAFDTHRHYNWDIYISTTNIAKIHKEVRQVAEYAYRHKNLAGLLPLPIFKGRFKRVKHDPENSGKSPTHYLGSSNKKIDRRVFDVYQSTKTGKAKDLDTNTDLLGSPKFIIFGSIVVFGVVSLGSTFAEQGSIFQFGASPDSQPHQQVSDASVPVGARSGSRVPPGAVSERQPVEAVDFKLRLFNSILYQSGSVEREGNQFDYWFHTHSGDVTSAMLLSLGINFRSYGRYYLVEYAGRSRLVPVGNPIHIDPTTQVTSAFDG